MIRNPYRDVVVFLQNAYDKGELAGQYSHAKWRKELDGSRSGQRLRLVFGSDHRYVRFCNSTKKVGIGAGADLPHDAAHVRRYLRSAKPSVVLACGRSAEKACLSEWAGDLFVMPHPCYRLLTDALLETVGRMLRWRVMYRHQLGVIPYTSLRADVVRLRFAQERDGVAMNNL